MTQKELLEKIAEITQLTQRQAQDVLKTTFDCIRDTMMADETFSIVGFGSFGTKIRSARKGRNPRTGEEMMIPKSKVAYFKPSSRLKTVLQTNLQDKE